MALIQIKLNEVTAANPCVFQPPHPPTASQMSGSSPLHLAPSPSALLSSCSTPSPRRRQQQGPLRLSAPLRPRAHASVCVCQHMLVYFTVNLSLCSSLADSHNAYFLLLVLLFTLRVCMCAFLQERFIFACDRAFIHIFFLMQIYSYM